MMHQSRSSPGAASGTGRKLAASYAQAAVSTVVGHVPARQSLLSGCCPTYFVRR